MADNKPKQQLRKNNRRKPGRGKRAEHYFVASYAYTQYSDFGQVQGESQNHLRVTRSRKKINVMPAFNQPAFQLPAQTENETSSLPDPSPQENEHSNFTKVIHGTGNISPGGRDVFLAEDNQSTHTEEEGVLSATGGETHNADELITSPKQTGSTAQLSQGSESGHPSNKQCRDPKNDQSSNIIPTQGRSANNEDLEDPHHQSRSSVSENSFTEGEVTSNKSTPPTKEDTTPDHTQYQVNLLGDSKDNNHNGVNDYIMQTLRSMDVRLKKLDTLEGMSKDMKQDMGKIHSRISSISTQMTGIQSDLKKAELKWEESEEVLKGRMLKVEKGCQKIEKALEGCKTALHSDLQKAQSSLDSNSSRILELENKLLDGTPNWANAEDLQEKIDLAAEKKCNKLYEVLREEVKKEVANDMEADKKTQEQKQAYQKLKDQAFAKRQNLLVFGISESKSREEDRTAVLHFFSDKMAIKKPNIETLYRLGAIKANKSRPILVKFSDINERWDIWKKRSTIKHDPKKPVWIQEDLPRKLREDNRVLLRILKTAKSMTNTPHEVRIQDFQIVFNGNKYDINNLHRLPREISPKMAFTPYSDEVVVFFTKHSPFSNHFPCTFVVDTVTFNCVEQFLALQRAFLAKNKPLTHRVMGTNNPADHKSVLNILHKDQPEVWKEKSKSLIMSTLRAKFFQNRDLAQFLMDTYPRLIGEASKNEVWGIGLSLDSREVLDNTKWRKEGNLLGISLSKIREELFASKNRAPKMRSPAQTKSN